MKKIFFLILVFFIGNGLFSQAERSRFQTYNSIMKISAFKDGENYMWENKKISVLLDYRIGTFTVKLRNSDFKYNRTEEILVSDSTQTELEYTFQGILPIREIINQKPINQKYVVELQLINWELSLDNTINFDLNVTNPGTNQANYRIFQLHGKLYNNELQLPAFHGFDNVIEIWIAFNGFSIVQ